MSLRQVSNLSMICACWLFSPIDILDGDGFEVISEVHAMKNKVKIIHILYSSSYDEQPSSSSRINISKTVSQQSSSLKLGVGTSPAKATRLFAVSAGELGAARFQLGMAESSCLVFNIGQASRAWKGGESSTLVMTPCEHKYTAMQ